MPVQLTLIPFEDVSQQDLSHLVNDLERTGFAIEIGKTLTMPANAYHATRRQYHADKLLALVHRQPGQRLLGITEQDLYAGNLNFVFGIAEMAGRAALISLHRLREAANQMTYRERTLKEAIHELGHSLGLPHCPDPKCVMHFSNSLSDTDYKSETFCAKCRELLNSQGITLAAVSINR